MREPFRGRCLAAGEAGVVAPPETVDLAPRLIPIGVSERRSTVSFATSPAVGANLRPETISSFTAASTSAVSKSWRIECQ
jgi:hypothetical protein